MSTSLDVWPRSTRIPDWETFSGRVQTAFADRCLRLGIKQVPKIKGRMYSGSDDLKIREAPKPGDELSWHPECALLVHLEGHPGGTNVRFRENSESEARYWASDVVPKHNSAWSTAALLDCLKPGHHWSFRRAAGSPGAISILYAIAAGCLAELVDGAVYSGDGAWDYDKFPLTGSEAIDVLMNPRAADEWGRGAALCEDDMRRMLKGSSSDKS